MNKMSAKKIKWGILGLGNIANQFVRDLMLVEGAELYAVASRNGDNAKAFASNYNAPKAYGDYDALINDENVDIIYIATPHDTHAALTIQSLNSKKHVLCEKPVAINHFEGTQMVAASKRNNCFFMEAFWTRFNPSFREALSKVKQGELGEVRYINADFSYQLINPEKRFTEIALGGGSLLDMGVYPIFLAYALLGKPEKILASSLFFETGADQQTAVILQYKNAQAILQSNFMSHSNMSPTISGTEGRITLNPMWHEAQGYSLIKNSHKTDYYLPTKGKGFTYEIEECHKCINNNQIESELWSHQNSLDLIEIVDQIRLQTGLTYSVDKNN
jgi:predicted dehydrogenase